MKFITSRENPDFKRLRALAKDAREVRTSGRALLDGPHLLAAALDAGIQPLRLAVSETGAVHREVQVLLARCAAIETVLLRDVLFRELVTTENPVGVLAEISIPTADSAEVRSSCVVLDGVQDTGNVGAIFRTAAAAGVGDVLLGPGCAGAWTPKVLRAGQGAHFALSLREQVDIAGFLPAFQGCAIATVARDGEPLYAMDLTGPIAWVFGNEGAGVSEKSVRAARRQATIPLAAGCESLNVAAAAAICLFEERRQKLGRMGLT